MVDARPLPLADMSNDSRALLDELLCTALTVGLVLVLLVPGARGMGTMGWWPLWLVGMPAVAWWALHGFRLPARETPALRASAIRVRRSEPQAWRALRGTRSARHRAAA